MEWASTIGDAAKQAIHSIQLEGRCHEGCGGG